MTSKGRKPATGVHLPREAFVHEQLPQRIVFGWGRLDEIAHEAERLGGTRVLLIWERSTYAFAQRSRDLLAGKVVAEMGPARPHVPGADVEQAKLHAVAEAVDLVITVGGGSATGLGKAVAIEGIPMIAAPTTYAGSEATPIYGITEGRRKKTGRHDLALPKAVVYDPSLTTSLPARATATTGMNAIAHCVEALYAQERSPITSLLAEQAITILRDALPACVRTPESRPARSAALYAAYLAGSVLAVTGMAIHHRICHVLGGTFGLAHGDVNAAVLPHAVEFNEPAAPRAIRSVADALATEDAASGLFDLSASLGAPTSLQGLGLDRRDLARVAELVAEGRYYNPREVDRDALTALLERAYEGRRPGG